MAIATESKRVLGVNAKRAFYEDYRHWRNPALLRFLPEQGFLSGKGPVLQQNGWNIIKIEQNRLNREKKEKIHIKVEEENRSFGKALEVLENNRRGNFLSQKSYPVPGL